MTKAQRRKVSLTDGAVGYILVAPALAIFIGIILYPFINSVFMSFTNKTLLTPNYKIVGFQNYAKVFADPTFGRTLLNTAVFVFFATLIPFVLGLIWSIVLNTKFRGAGVLRGVTLINWIIPGASISFLWAFIFDANHGIVNEALKSSVMLSLSKNIVRPF